MTPAASANVASHLPAMAGRQPYTLAVLEPAGRDRRGLVRYTHWTYRQLDETSDRLAWGLEARGVRRGVRTVLMVKPGQEFFALTFALFKLGAVPVVVDPGMGVRNLGRCLAEAQPEAFIGIPRAHAARVLFGWARSALRVLVTVGRRGPWGGTSLDRVLAEAERSGQSATPYPPAAVGPDETAAVLFTSGSTGAPKGAVYTHGIFSAQVDMLRETFGIRPGEIDLCTFPLFALFAPALGMTAVVPDMDVSRPARVDARKLVRAVEDFGVTNLFGSPALIRRVCQTFGDELSRLKLPSLRRVISAGAPVGADVLERFAPVLAPGVQVYTPYGATEALPVSSIGSDEVLRETRQQTAKGAGVCVGRPVRGMEVAVIRISDGPIPTWSDDLVLPAGEIGEIAVRGPVVTREYFNRPQSTALAKIADPLTLPSPPGGGEGKVRGRGGFWHRMGDVGYLDETGRLWFCGRKAHRVVTAQGTLFTIPCEAVFNAHPAVARTALVCVGPAGSARPVLCVELNPEADGSSPDRTVRELLDLGSAHPHTRDIHEVLFYPGSFPVDPRHNAKIIREKLAAWAARELR